MLFNISELIGFEDVNALRIAMEIQPVLKPSNYIQKNLKTLSSYHPTIITEENSDLLIQLLCINPQKRITAREALNHSYFKTNHH